MNNGLNEFWSQSDYFTNSMSVTEEMVVKAEEKLGYKLPSAYIELIKTKNGGTPINSCFPTTSPTSWADDHIAIESIRGIGGEHGVDSEDVRDSDEDWGYPTNIGFVICDCPSAGHDAVMLDYSQCGKSGEPRVIHVDVEVSDKPVVTLLSNNFKSFLQGLTNSSEYED
ncbi:SMI1/KNR4 family protein [Thermoactinomyces sp. DSM 45892]|uniref:SMI1/KNR4 family protein n=1 Tax=Thermoactinomyces sp. DSM 45892 TaxID=1882753 RepID=UPI000896451C|nr:SMI1/KNR4 family protein [Thermoactinomyces sp. DSM 45892]SDX96839.1 SMI1-KNR4 cell-wall [Thermoactinomyces sp. DSM 45892]